MQEPGLLLSACSQGEQYLRKILRPVVAAVCGHSLMFSSCFSSLCLLQPKQESLLRSCALRIATLEHAVQIVLAIPGTFSRPLST